MVVLDLDVGNTRIKWRCGEKSGALLHSDDWSRAFDGFLEIPNRVRIGNVAGNEIAEQLTNWLHAQWAVVPEFAATSHSASGVICGYPQPAQLGVDRWLAILASYHKVCLKAASDVVVVSAGSAVTVDLLRASGNHLGGYIVPGLEMQRRSLFTGTSAVKVNTQWQLPTIGIGSDTVSAVTNGCLKMVAALIDVSRSQLGAEVPVVLCGGDALYLRPHLEGAVYLEAELVLDGLSVLMP